MTLRLYLSGEKKDGRFAFVPAPLATDAMPDLRVDLADRSDADFTPPDDRPDARNALVFATAPLDRATEVDGLFRGSFKIVTNKRDFDLSVDFYEQRADGSFLSLASYLGRASYMADRSHRHLLKPGQPARLAFHSQTLTARRLAAGSRIVAVIGIPKRPGVQINYGTGKDVSDESVADAKDPVRIRWRHGSYLELRVR